MEKVLRELLTDLKKEMIVEVREIVKEEISGLREDVSSLKTDVSILKTDVNSLKSDVSILKTDVSGLKEKVEYMEANMATKHDMELIHHKLDILTEQVVRNSEQEPKLYDVIERVTILETDMKVVKRAIANQSI